MALVSALVGMPGGAVGAGKKALVGFFGVVRTNPVAATQVTPSATFVVPRNQHPAHWPGRMQIQTEPRDDRPVPWNYKTRQINHFWKWFDACTDRFDEYSRVIVVDGNIGSGKTTLAKQIAQKFDLLYFPEPDSRMMYSGVPPFNDDFREPEFQSKLHPRIRKYDLEDFYREPNKRPARAAELQNMFYEWRYYQYAEACVHLTNTGQGVVLDRSIFSDHVFADTLFDLGMMNRKCHNWYHFRKAHTIVNFWRPHLCIYLDCPVDVCLKRIKERGNPAEVNSKFLNEEYLETLERHYKTSFLPEMETYGELIVSEHPDYDDIETVLEDITRLDFSYEIDDPKKFEDWRNATDDVVSDYRIECQDPDKTQKWLHPPGLWRVPELWIDGQLDTERQDVYEQNGFNTSIHMHGFDERVNTTKEMNIPGRRFRRHYKYLDNMATPVLGKEFETVELENNPIAGHHNPWPAFG